MSRRAASWQLFHRSKTQIQETDNKGGQKLVRNLNRKQVFVW
jgi:hypothetical protein